MKKIENILGVLLLIFSIGFNLWLYRLEPSIMVDPNDNTFQYALVDRTNQIWDFASKNCSKNFPFLICHLSFLVDHWVPNWAQGYNLPYYYTHIPQIAIVGSYRMLSVFSPLDSHVTLFQYYHIVTYVLLSFFPLSVFLALRIIGSPRSRSGEAGLSWMTAGIGALLATHISTDGLYGLDPPSFLFRGYGLTSQLFAMGFLPISIAYAYRYLLVRLQENFSHDRNSILPAILTLAATTAGHLGIGIIAFLSIAILAISPFIQSILLQEFNKSTIKQLFPTITKLCILFGGVGLLLGYWIIPTLLHNNYHNISIWDPLWKFNSFGAKEVLTLLFNGNLFDFGRFPTLTILVFIGIFTALITNYYLPFTLLFVFWLIMFFGRTTWGGLIDLIPGMTEFHLSRFIVGLHLAGLFLVPIGIEKLYRLGAHVLQLLTLPYRFSLIIFAGLVGLVVLSLYPQTIRYSTHNDFLIRRANDDYLRVKDDVDSLFLHLKSYISDHPGRVYAGRAGWGSEFRVADTPYNMHLSTYGIPTVLWLPQTWSPNSDTEQYFSEGRLEDYVLYNIRYVVTPTGTKVPPQQFWKTLKETNSWKLYEVATSEPALSGVEGYITTGIKPAIVSSSKEDFINVVHLWIQSDYPKNGLYPELTFAKNYPRPTGLPNFKMLDEVTYKTPDNKTYNLFSGIPIYQTDPKILEQCNNITITSAESLSDMIFKTTVEKQGDAECLVILKQTYHPSWHATIDGKSVKPFAVFPFYTAIVLTTAGTHDIVFSYQPSSLKTTLLLLSFVSLGVFLFLRKKGRRPK